MMIMMMMMMINEVNTMTTRQNDLVVKNSLDAGIQDKSTSISIVVKFEQVSNDDESDKHI